MIKNYYWAIAVAASFVAGTIATATPVFAPPPEDDGEGGWKAAIAEQQAQIDELKANEILGFYKVRDQQTATAQDAINGAVSEATCDPSDVPVSVGFFGPPGVRVDGMSISEELGGSAGVALENLVEGSAFGVGVNCADFDPPHANS